MALGEARAADTSHGGRVGGGLGQPGKRQDGKDGIAEAGGPGAAERPPGESA